MKKVSSKFTNYFQENMGRYRKKGLPSRGWNQH